MNKAKSHIAWMASAGQTDRLKPVDKAIRDMTATLPGRSESEFTIAFG